MMINALNSGAKVFMADCEDALSPPWSNVVAGQASCMDAVRRTLQYTSPEGKPYRLGERLATLVLRPRGWHLEEAHFRVDGRPVPAALFDFALYSTTTATSCCAAGAVRTSTCRNWRAISRPGSGTTSSTRPRRAGPSTWNDPGHRADRDHLGGV